MNAVASLCIPHNQESLRPLHLTLPMRKACWEWVCCCPLNHVIRASWDGGSFQYSSAYSIKGRYRRFWAYYLVSSRDLLKTLSSCGAISKRTAHQLSMFGHVSQIKRLKANYFREAKKLRRRGWRRWWTWSAFVYSLPCTMLVRPWFLVYTGILR